MTNRSYTMWITVMLKKRFDIIRYYYYYAGMTIL